MTAKELLKHIRDAYGPNHDYTAAMAVMMMVLPIKLTPTAPGIFPTYQMFICEGLRVGSKWSESDVIHIHWESLYTTLKYLEERGKLP